MTTIPIIDFASNLGLNTWENQKLITTIDTACREIGFFIIINPPIDGKILGRVYEQASDFFSLSTSLKMKYYIGNQPNHRGYVPPGEEQYGALQGTPGIDVLSTEELKEGFEIGTSTPKDDPDFLAGVRFLGPNVWPEELPNFRPVVERYYEQTMALGTTLFRIFARALNINETIFFEMTKKPVSNLRLLYYHPRPVIAGKELLGIGAHTDSECFTILSTRGDGLQVVTRDGQWVNVPSIEGAFIVNIGDTMEVWTNGTYVSTQHRVVSNGKERWSLPLFFAADYFQNIEPLPQFVNPSEPSLYRPFVSGVHKLSEYAKGFRYLKFLARRGEIKLESEPDDLSRFVKKSS